MQNILSSNEKIKNNAEEYFNSISVEWDKKYNVSSLFRKRYQSFKKLISKYNKDRTTALDYGCGSGNLTVLLTENFQGVTATDLSGKMLEITSRRFSGNSKVKVLPLNELKDLKFDLIICSSVIEYCDDDAELFNNLSSCLAKSGVLIITFPNRFGFLQLLNRYILRFFIMDNYTKYQKHTYTVSRIESLVSDIGFELKELFRQPGLFNSNLLSDLYFCVIEKK